MVFCRVRLDNVVNPAAGINAPQALMSALPPKADVAERHRDVRFVPKADIEPRRLGARYRQDRHDFHGISRKDREVRMPLERFGGGVM